MVTHAPDHNNATMDNHKPYGGPSAADIALERVRAERRAKLTLATEWRTNLGAEYADPCRTRSR